ncbi:hypothetical protein NXS13_00145 [Corynebacterium sp. ES2730-CONJ]|uniref:trypsin-like serine protease n=1 Tax=Corynebacterium sp. ES2730-CONJ TaxID=2973941 RepID=UPI00216B1B7E|nr:trypsin-like serine protease [Corynebacterium sp. ES2730-CONJ]MCS4530918.1 hypothetical protein [Corynebacterium sp. ES2730-CONJ]
MFEDIEESYSIWSDEFIGEVAGIAAIHTNSPNDDVAFIKVGTGIHADTFILANEPLTIGDQAVLTGYAQRQDYASSAKTVISKKVDSLDFGNATYTAVFKGTSATASRSCGGDSGAPIYKDNTLYAVHIAGGFNPECNDGKDRPMWHTHVVPRVSWIKETVHNNSSFTDQEKSKANIGLKHAATVCPDASKPQVPHEGGLSSTPPSSSFKLSST